MAGSKKTKLVAKWLKRIERESDAHKDFRRQGKRSDEAARDEISGKSHTFNIHWANCRILRSAIYANAPKPDVRRRFTQPDPEEKELARLVERALEFNLDVNSFDVPSKAVAKDFVQSSLGVPRVIYDVTTEGEGEAEVITSQGVGIEHVPWKHFHWEPGHSDWKNVGWIAYEYFSTPAEIKSEYGVEVKASKDDEEKHRKAEKYTDEVQVFEIWDKRSRSVLVIARGHKEPLEARKDELNLQGFFPSPRPALDNVKSDELIPKPDYCFIEPQIQSLNRLTERRANLVKHIKAVRLYDASIADELSSLESAGDAVNIPVTNLTERLEGSAGMDRVVVDLPMADRVAVVKELDAQIESVKNEIYEIIGISDIIRGTTKASETAAAQNLKGQWANVRLNDKTDEINRVWRDVLRMMAEIICEHFEPEQLQMMTGIQITPRMSEMMQSDIGRSFAIGVESDSTILKDDMDERQQKLDLVNLLLEKFGYVLPMVQQGILPVEIVKETLLFIVSSHKHGKQLEDVIAGLGESMASLQDFQQVQQQLQQSQQQLQGAQQQLQQVNEREQARLDQESEARAAKDNAQAIKLELELMDEDYDDDEGQLDDVEQMADIDKTRAETRKIRTETAAMPLQPIGIVQNG